jgi:two-component system OmpR family response regulator
LSPEPLSGRIVWQPATVYRRHLTQLGGKRVEASKSDRHILLVEDDSDLVIVLVQVLEQEGYRVSAATQRREARALLRKGGIDLIVADSVLRGGNGDDIAKAAARRGVPIIMVSGEPERIARLQEGSLPFLQKPFRAASLVRLIAQLLP